MALRYGTLSVLLALAPTQGVPQGVSTTIEHAGVGCMVAGQFPRLDARIAPAEKLARARVFFHAGDSIWYYVDMKPEAGVFQGVLPRPLKATTRIHYYIEAIDKAMVQSRTPEYAAAIVPDASACSKTVAAAAVAGASKVVVGAPAGAPAVPAGFAANTIVVAGAAAGGGLGTTALVIGGVAVAGGVGAAVALKQASDNEDIVKAYRIEGFAVNLRGGPGFRVPYRGAVVSSSLDSVTTTTDAQGHFVLEPTTPCHAKRNPRGEGGGVEFTVTIVAAGCPTHNTTKKWGCAGESPVGDINLNLNGDCR